MSFFSRPRQGNARLSLHDVFPLTRTNVSPSVGGSLLFHAVFPESHFLYPGAATTFLACISIEINAFVRPLKAVRPVDPPLRQNAAHPSSPLCRPFPGASPFSCPPRESPRARTFPGVARRPCHAVFIFSRRNNIIPSPQKLTKNPFQASLYCRGRR